MGIIGTIALVMFVLWLASEVPAVMGIIVAGISILIVTFITVFIASLFGGDVDTFMWVGLVIGFFVSIGVVQEI